MDNDLENNTKIIKITIISLVSVFIGFVIGSTYG